MPDQPDLLWWGSNPCNGPSNTLIGAFYCLSGPASQCRVGQDHGWIYRVRRSVSQCQQQRGRPSGHDGWFVTWSQWQKWPGIGNIALSTVRTTKDQSAFHTCKCTTAESHAARKLLAQELLQSRCEQFCCQTISCIFAFKNKECVARQALSCNSMFAVNTKAFRFSVQLAYCILVYWPCDNSKTSVYTVQYLVLSVFILFYVIFFKFIFLTVAMTEQFESIFRLSPVWWFFISNYSPFELYLNLHHPEKKFVNSSVLMSKWLRDERTGGNPSALFQCDMNSLKSLFGNKCVCYHTVLP